MEYSKEELSAKLDEMLERLEIEMIMVKVIGEEIQELSEKLKKLEEKTDLL